MIDSSHKFVKDLMGALGFGDKDIKAIELRCAVGEPITAKAEFFIGLSETRAPLIKRYHFLAEEIEPEAE